MDILNAIILGVIQGATEFIPVSSSGHLVLAHSIFGASTNDLGFDAILQLATALAVLVFFWGDFLKLIKAFWNLILRKEVDVNEKILIWAIILGTIPAVAFGLLLESEMETVFRNVNLVALSLILGSLLMFFAERFSREDRDLTVGKGIKVGFFQCLALIPGMSRSGATISGGLISGLKRDMAVKFSFLLSFPIILGSGLKKTYDLAINQNSFSWPTLLISSLTAFIVGLWAIKFLTKYLKNHKLNFFIYYRLILAAIIFLFF